MNPIFPSILSTDFFNLEERLDQYRAGGIETIHLDIMDGHFVEPITFGAALARAIRSRFPFRFDAHLMVDDPARIAPAFLDAGCEWISFHVEAGDDEGARRLCREIRRRGSRAGLVLNPGTALERLWPLLDEADYVLLMSVVPGRGGQAFIPATLERARGLAAEIRRRGVSVSVEIDGGINAANIAAARAAGVDLFVVGNSLYNAADPQAALQNLYEQIQWSPS